MATGDLAAADGMAIVAGGAAANTIDTELNLTRDYIAARHTETRPINKGGTGATSASGARTALGINVVNLSAWGNSGAVSAGSAPSLGWIGGGRIAFAVPGYAGTTTLANYSDVGGPSSRRFKKDIAALSPDKQAILAMQLVQFRYRVAVDEDQSLQVGLIAEDLHDLGLEWLVEYDDEGRPSGVRYFRIALALLPIVQDHEARIAALEAGNV
jgi:hypothetical protein